MLPRRQSKSEAGHQGWKILGPTPDAVIPQTWAPGPGTLLSWVSVSTSMKWAGRNTYDVVKLGGPSKVMFFQTMPAHMRCSGQASCNPFLASTSQVKPLRGTKEKKGPAQGIWAPFQICFKPFLKARTGSNVLSLAWVASSVKWVDRGEGQIRCYLEAYLALLIKRMFY